MYMIKVFLVEDEVVIRDAIKNSINWEQEGYEFVGEASDGELALPMILKRKAGHTYHRYSYAVYGWAGVKSSCQKRAAGHKYYYS